MSTAAKVSPITIHAIIAWIQKENLLYLKIATKTAMFMTTLQMMVKVVSWNSTSDSAI